MSRVKREGRMSSSAILYTCLTIAVGHLGPLGAPALLGAWSGVAIILAGLWLVGAGCAMYDLVRGAAGISLPVFIGLLGGWGVLYIASWAVTALPAYAWVLAVPVIGVAQMLQALLLKVKRLEHQIARNRGRERAATDALLAVAPKRGESDCG